MTSVMILNLSFLNFLKVLSQNNIQFKDLIRIRINLKLFNNFLRTSTGVLMKSILDGVQKIEFDESVD